MSEKVTKIDDDTVQVEREKTETDITSMTRKQVLDEKAKIQLRLTALDNYLTVMNGA